MGFLFKIGTFTQFYAANWWVGVLVLQTGRSVKRGYSQNIDCKNDIMDPFSFSMIPAKYSLQAKICLGLTFVLLFPLTADSGF